MINEMYEKKNFSEIEKKTGIKFNDPNNLVQAFVHRSYLNENRDFSLPHNERLEFLGDAVLEIVVTEYLFDTFLNPEGELTSWRASLVNAKMCSRIASEIGMNNFMLLSRGESKDVSSKAREYILANALEAFIGSIYYDQGWDSAKKFIHEWVISKLDNVLENNLWIDPKSRFQESAQEKLGITPTYKVLNEEGPDHNKDFTVGAFLNKEKIAEGKGTSKQEAQTSAAEEALKVKKWKGSEVKILKRNK
ncbi:MAG: ribonuclease III [Candidatus Magasanikbacteria bacterium]|nr:ribonuclease III [Candidatus Magasanikbacteria bacterium]